MAMDRLSLPAPNRLPKSWRHQWRPKSRWRLPDSSWVQEANPKQPSIFFEGGREFLPVSQGISVGTQILNTVVGIVVQFRHETDSYSLTLM
jgi:hypothetical protein